MKKQTISAVPKGAGYTIVEVVIFLAVSAFIMLAAFRLIDGKQAQTDFTQAARNTQSQLQTWIDSSSSGFTGADPTTQSCTINGRPTVVNTAPGPTYTPECVYLGEAIQFPPDNANGNIIYGYPVFGARLSNGALPTDLNSSLPTPAAGQGGGVPLTDTFGISPLYVYSVKSTGLDSSNNPSSNTTSHLVGYYGSINTDAQFNSNNGQSDVNAYQYQYGGSATAGDQQAINCIEMTTQCGFNPSTAYPDKLTSLDICLTDGVRYAQMLINSTNGIGADVILNYLNTANNC